MVPAAMDPWTAYFLIMLGIAVAVTILRAFPVLWAVFGLLAVILGILTVADWVGVDREKAAFWTGMAFLVLLAVVRLIVGSKYDGPK